MANPHLFLTHANLTIATVYLLVSSHPRSRSHSQRAARAPGFTVRRLRRWVVVFSAQGDVPSELTRGASLSGDCLRNQRGSGSGAILRA